MFPDSIRFAFRSVIRRPGMALAGAVTLAIGIGASIAVFSILKAAVLDPLPYPESGRLVHVFRNQPPVNYGPTSREGFLDLLEDPALDIKLSGYTWDSFTLNDSKDAARVVGARVAKGFFETLGLEPALGRWLTDADQAADAPPVAVISRALWQGRYEGRNDVLGKEIRLNGAPHVIVGVAGSDMDFPMKTEVWTPARFEVSGGGGNYIMLFARLGAGVTESQLEAWTDTHTRQWAEVNPGMYKGLSFHAYGFNGWRTRGMGEALWLMFGAVALVLLIACGNVANLQLTQTLSRGRELATRAAMGARNRELMLGAIAESAAVASLGLVGGIAIAQLGILFMRSRAASFIPRVDTIGIDAEVLVFALLATLLTALLCGILPALFARRVNVAVALRSGSKGSAGGSQRWRKGLVIGELAMCMGLLVAALLVITSLHKLEQVDPGFETDRLLTARVVIAPPLDQDDWQVYAEQQQQFFENVAREAAALPGVESVGAIDTLPVTGTNNWNGGVQISGQQYDDGRGPTVEWRFVSPAYFQTLGLPLLQGEGFDNSADASRIVVNQAFVDTLLADGDVIGRGVQALGLEFRISGVVGNARQWNLRNEASPEIYFRYGTSPAPISSSLALRTQGDPLALTAALRETIRRINPEVPVFDVQTMNDIVDRSHAQQSFVMQLLVAFGVCALLIASIGLYAVLAYIVSQRTRDIGVQLALGASSARILRATLLEASLLAGTGVLVGVVIGLGIGRLMQSQMFGIRFYEPGIYVGAAIFLAAIALLASLLPAWRASRVQPMEALRYE